MAVTPQTNIKLLKVPITLDNKNQLTFSNATTQYNYFNSCPKLEIEECSYQRKDNIIRYPAHIDDILEYNYVMYQNENYTNKWFYAFITNMTYVNDGLTYVQIATDVYQSWQFDITFKRCFVEREMLSKSDDVPGANLVPEDLEFGELQIDGTAEIDGLKPIFVLAYGRNPYEDGLIQTIVSGQGVTLNGIPSGLFYCVASETYLSNILESINNKGFGESIVAVFSVPCLAFVGFNNWTIEDLQDEGFLMWITDDFTANPITTNLISRPANLDGYTPRNKKLLTYPYLYVGFNPVNGTSKIFRYEDFSNGTPSFKICSEINPNPSIFVIPQNYRGQSGDSLSDCSSINGYPQISWVSDYYNSWLAQNSEIIKVSMAQAEFEYNLNNSRNILNSSSNLIDSAKNLEIGSFITTGGNASLNYLQNQANYDYGIKNQMAQIEKQQLLPNTAHSGTSATLLGYNLINDNIFTRYAIKSQFAERIDSYFDMFGYLTNEVKIPNLNNRSNWNYVKTIGAIITGNIPQMDLQQIKNMFDNGITLWHNSNTFLDYSQSNN